MKILILSHYFPPEVNAPAKRIFEHSKIFNELNNEIVVITNFPNHPKGKIFDGYKNKWLSKSIVEGIKVIRVYTYLTPNKGIFKRSFNYFLFMILSAFHGLKKKCRYYYLNQSSAALWYCRDDIIKNKKNSHVFEIRDIWPSSIAAVGIIKKNNLGYRFLNFIEKKIIYSAQIVAVVTDGIFSYVKKYRKENVILVTNGVMTDNFNYKKTTINNNQLTFGYVGTIGKAHNTKIILEAAKYFEDEKRINFKIIGDGAEKETIFNQAMQIKKYNDKRITAF